MKKCIGLYEVATEIFDNLMWANTEAVIHTADRVGVYTVGYRNIGSLGNPEYESTVLCTVDLSPEMWHDSLADWGIDSDLIGTSDLHSELAYEYTEGALFDLIQQRIDERWEELGRA